jgi:hypothetical protein
MVYFTSQNHPSIHVGYFDYLYSQIFPFPF